MTDPVEVVVAALQRARFDPRPTGSDSYEARCPAHNGSAQIRLGEAQIGEDLALGPDVPRIDSEVQGLMKDADRLLVAMGPHRRHPQHMRKWQRHELRKNESDDQ